MAKWTEKDIPNLKGKTILVTGGNSGLGFESCKMMAKKDGTIILASRSIERGKEARSKILAEYSKAKIEVMQLDLSSLQSVENFSKEFHKKYHKLDILLNNAGIMMTPYGETKDGFEQQNGVNHLGHFKLTALLLDLLKKTKGARIVNVSSMGHRMGSFDPEDYLYKNKEKYSPTSSYGLSKLSNLLFTYELDRRLQEKEYDIKVLVAHPGVSNTNLMRYINRRWWFIIFYPLMLLFVQNAYKGALPQVRACVDPNALSGQYYGPRGLGEASGAPVIVQSNKESHNQEHQKVLFELSEELVQEKFSI